MRYCLWTIKINFQIMQRSRMLQAAGLMMIVALAASCTASKQYSSKLFGPRNEAVKDSAEYAIRFLELETLNKQEEGWVSTDIITKDSSSVTPSMESIAEVKKPAPIEKFPVKETVIKPDVTDKKKVPVTEPVAHAGNQNGTRNKTTRE